MQDSSSDSSATAVTPETPPMMDTDVPVVLDAPAVQDVPAAQDVPDDTATIHEGTTTDPYDFLMNAASDESLWLLIGGPVGLLAVIIAIYAILIVRKRHREDADLKREVEQAEDGVVIPLPGRGPKTEEPIPAFKLPEDLEEEEAAERAEAEERARVLEETPAPAPAILEVEEVRRTDRTSWMARLRSGLTKTRDSLRGSLEGIFSQKTKIDASMLERLHEALYRADIGVATSDKLVGAVRTRLGKEEAASWESVSACLRDEAAAILSKSTGPINTPASGPQVILVVGVNGVGKTTTIGKLAAHFLAEDKKVLLAAADTFRAAAIEQLEVWGQRLGVEVIRHKAGADPAAVAYDGVKAAIARGSDVLLIDTAGRLHSKNELMDELGKINRVIGKDLPGAPHETWLVIDATTGQNAVMQVKAFREVVGLTGLVVTKLDGTAKGGVLIGIADQFSLPIRYVGVGEKAADLRAFNVNDYAESLF